MRLPVPLRRASLNQGARDLSVLAGAVNIGFIAFQGSQETNPDPSGSQAARDLAIGGVACLILLLFRRRWPVRVTLVLSVMAVFSGSAWGTAAMGVFTVAVHRSWKATAAVTTLNVSYITLLFLMVEGMGRRERFESALVFAFGYAALVATGLFIRSRRQLIESLKERARQAEEGQRLRIEEARHLERERIAREMHDVLAHRISLLAVHAGALEFHADAPADQREAAGVIRDSAYEAMEDLREVIGVLRGPPGDVPGDGEAERPQPTLSDVPALVRESRRAGAHITLDDRVARTGDVPDRVGRHAYRIVQEGLTNARKHAPGAHVRVTMVPAERGLLSIEISNPLPSGPARALELPGAGAGLLGLRERVNLLGGTLEHGRTPDDRFRVHARLPYQS